MNDASGDNVSNFEKLLRVLLRLIRSNTLQRIMITWKISLYVSVVVCVFVLALGKRELLDRKLISSTTNKTNSGAKLRTCSNGTCQAEIPVSNIVDSGKTSAMENDAFCNYLLCLLNADVSSKKLHRSYSNETSSCGNTSYPPLTVLSTSFEDVDSVHLYNYSSSTFVNASIVSKRDINDTRLDTVIRSLVDRLINLSKTVRTIVEYEQQQFVNLAQFFHLFVDADSVHSTCVHFPLNANERNENQENGKYLTLKKKKVDSSNRHNEILYKQTGRFTERFSTSDEQSLRNTTIYELNERIANLSSRLQNLENQLTFSSCAKTVQITKKTCNGERRHLVASSCYFIPRIISELDLFSWWDARYMCKRELGPDADLVTIETKQEMVALVSLLTNHFAGIEEFWLGASDLDQEGDWRWAMTGVSLAQQSYHNWAYPSALNNIGQRCMSMTQGYSWITEPCFYKRHPICELNV